MSFIDSTPHTPMEKSHFSARIPIQLHTNEHFSIESTSREWRWSDDWVIMENGANRKCFVIVMKWFPKPVLEECILWSKHSRIDWFLALKSRATFWSLTWKSQNDWKFLSKFWFIVNIPVHFNAEFVNWNGVRSSSQSVRQPNRTRNNFFRSKKTPFKGNKFPICCHKFMQQKT